MSMPRGQPKPPPDVPSFEPDGPPKLKLSPEDMNDVARLAEQYLSFGENTEITEFSEDDLHANLLALYRLSKRKRNEMAKAHARKVQSIVSEASIGWHPNVHYSDKGGGGNKGKQKHTSSHLKEGTDSEHIIKESNSRASNKKDEAENTNEKRAKAQRLEREAKEELDGRYSDVMKRMNYAEAGRIYEELGDYEKAGEMYYGVFRASDSLFHGEKRRKYIADAEECFRKAGKIEKASEMYDTASYHTMGKERLEFEIKVKECFKEAAEKYEKDKNMEMAGEMYQHVALNSDKGAKIKFFAEAGRCYVEANDKEKAAEAYRDAANASAQYANPAIRARYGEKAKECFKDAALKYEEEKNMKKAAEMYKNAAIWAAGNIETASAVREGVAMGKFWTEAGRCYKEAGEMESAGEMYRSAAMISQGENKAELMKKAKECFEDEAKKNENANMKWAGKVYESAARCADGKEKEKFIFLSKLYETCSLIEEPSDIEFLRKILPKLKESGAVRKLPQNALPLLIEEVIGKKGEFEKRIDDSKQLEEALKRPTERMAKEYKEFKGYYLVGKRIPEEYWRYMLVEIKDLMGNDFLDSILSLSLKFGVILPPNASYAELAKLNGLANQKLKPPFKLATRVVKKEFTIEEIELSLTKEDALALRDALSTAKKGQADMEKINKSYTEIANLFAIEDAGTRKNKVVGLMRRNGTSEKTVESFEKGKIDEKNAMRMLLANYDFGELSPLVWKGITEGMNQRQPGSLIMFEKFAQSGMNGLTEKEANMLILRMKEFVGTEDQAGIMEDWLESQKLGGLMPKLRKCSAFQAIIRSLEKVRTQEAGAAKNTREMTLIFGQENRLLDVYFGKHAGECFGDDPEYSLGRKDICTATLFQNGEVAGGVLFLMRKINSKKSLIVIAIDPSEKVVAGLNYEKQGEIVDWMMKEVAYYAKQQRFALNITGTAGGISQRVDGDITDKYFGNNMVSYEQSGPFHQIFGYNIHNAVDFIAPK